jgi:hypothetical protein
MKTPCIHWTYVLLAMVGPAVWGQAALHPEYVFEPVASTLDGYGFVDLARPSIDTAGNVAFLGTKPSESGVYVAADGADPQLRLSVGSEMSGSDYTFHFLGPPTIDEGAVTVFGRSSASELRGVYRHDGSSLSLIADTTMPSTPLAGSFATFMQPTLCGDVTAFIATDAVGTKGIYASRGGELEIAFDPTIPLPSGEMVNVSSAPLGIMEHRVLFSANPRGIYEADLNSGSVTRRVGPDTMTPNGLSLGYCNSISVDGNDFAFIGYAQTVQDPSSIYAVQAGSLRTVVDANTPCPGSDATFDHWSSPGISMGSVTFLGESFADPNSRAIYREFDGRLERIVGVGDDLDGRAIETIAFGDGSGAGNALAGETFALKLAFSDATEAIYTIRPMGPLLLGDMNADNVLSIDDLQPFLTALADRNSFAAAWPGVNADRVGDIDASGSLGIDDLQPFLVLLASDTAVPEPGALALLSAGALTLWRSCRRRTLTTAA